MLKIILLMLFMCNIQAKPIYEIKEKNTNIEIKYIKRDIQNNSKKIKDSLMTINKCILATEFNKKDIKNNKSKIKDNSLKIDDYKLHSELNKKEIKALNNRISDAVEQLNFSINLYSILFTILVLGYTIINYLTSKSQLEATLQEMKNINNKAKNKLDEINRFHKDASLKKKDIDEYINQLSLSEKDKNEVFNLSNELKNLPEKEYKYNDWWIKFLNYFNKKSYENALYCLNKGLELKNLSIKEELSLLLAKAVIYQIKEEYINELCVYNSIIKKQKYHTEKDLYGSTLVKKALLFSQNNKIAKAIQINNQIIDKYKNSEFEVKAIKAFINNIELSIIQKNKIDNNHEDLIERISNDNEFKSDFAIYEMFKIIEQVANNKYDVEEDIIDWSSKYKNLSLIWRFNELDNWVQNHIYKDNLEKTINQFKPYFNELEYTFL
jgi:hypothetical protein